MRAVIISSLLVGCIAIAGCAVDTDEEQEEVTATSEDPLVTDCIAKITAPIGSAAWSAAVQKCVSQGGGSSSGGGSCSTGVSCYNGVCRCTLGPNKGRACNGRITSGSTSCSVMCKVCK